MASKKKVVIIGNGVAGSKAAAQLAKIEKYDITVVTPVQFHEVPLKMTKVIATGSEVHNGTIFDLVKEDGVTYEFATCTNIEGNTASLSNGTQLSFDSCIVATGLNIPIFYPDMEKECSIADRKAGVQAFFEKVKAANTIVISGGGPVGVEAAGDIKLRFPQKQITLVTSGATVLEGMSPQFPPLVQANLTKIGVKLVLNDRVKEQGEGYVLLNSGTRLDADLYIPAYSQGPNTGFVPAGSKDDKGYIKVDKKFQVEGLKNVFAFSACSNISAGKAISPIDDQIVTVIANVQAALDGAALKDYTPGMKGKFVSPLLVSVGHLGHGVTESFGVGPDVAACSLCCFVCPCVGGCCAHPAGPAAAKIKSDFNETYGPVKGQGMGPR